MQRQTLQSNVGDPSDESSGQVNNEKVEEKVAAAPDQVKSGEALGAAESKDELSDDDSEDHGLTLQTKLRKQFKAVEELKEKKKVLDDILKEAEEQNEVIQEILEEIDGQKDLLKNEREQFKAEHAETVDKIKEIKKELKDEGELLSDMLLVAYDRKEEVMLTDKDGKTLILKLQAKLAIKK